MKSFHAGASKNLAAALIPSRRAATSKGSVKKAGSIAGWTKGSAEVMVMVPPMEIIYKIDSTGEEEKVHLRDLGVKSVITPPATGLSPP